MLTIHGWILWTLKVNLCNIMPKENHDPAQEERIRRLREEGERLRRVHEEQERKLRYVHRYDI